MRVVAICALAASLALAGCTQSGGSSSSKDFSGEKAKVADKIGDLSKAGTGKKAAEVCDDIVTGALRDSIAAGNRSCAQEMKDAMDDADAFDLKVDAVTITGPKATARVKTKDRDKDVTRTFQPVKQGSGWRVSSFG